MTELFHSRQWRLALLLLALAYAIHFLYCADSILPAFDRTFANSDMHANLRWAETIQDQGWLNPRPYHPYNTWMKEIAPLETWCRWWGGAAIFQQSPLYAYLLAAFLSLSRSLLLFHFLQCLAGAGLCVLLAWLAEEIFGCRRTTWLALILAGLYAPFYAYSWPLLRDPIGWILLAGAIPALASWSRALERGTVSASGSFLTGGILGLGLLARETFYLIIPLSLALLWWRSRQKKLYRPLLLVIAGLAVVLMPLVIRNVSAGAPALSSSNRFAENFIEGNAASALPVDPFIPYETRAILMASEGRPLAVVCETLATQPSAWSWSVLQGRKIISLFDPYEAPCSVSIYYLQEVSPLVRWGLPHWLIFIPGLGGLLLGLRRRDRRQCWLWIFGLSLMASLMMTIIESRYRQSLALLWVPWAAYFLVALADQVQRRAWRKAVPGMLLLLMGWWACLVPFAVTPSNRYHRSAEFILAAEIYQMRGDPEQARQSMEQFERLTGESGD